MVDVLARDWPNLFGEAVAREVNEFVAKDWDWKTNGLILARNEVDYILPVYLSDKVQVRVYCDHIGTKSFTLSYELFSENDQGDRNVHTKGRSILVCMNYKKQETVAIYEGWSEALQIL